MAIDVTAINQTVRNVPMMSVQNVNATNQIDIKHYIKKHKEHEARRASFNERMEYWRSYYEQMGRLVSQSERSDSGLA